MRHISDDIGGLENNFVNQPMGISTGFDELDQAIWGLQPGQLMVVGGRPAMGKTSFMADVALSASKESPIGIFSLEMPFDRLQARLCANLADLNYRNIRAGNTSKREQKLFMEAGDLLKDKQIYIEDEPGIIGMDDYWLKQRKLSISKTMDYKIKTMVKEHGCKVIIVDYLQLIMHINAGMKDRRLIVGSVCEMLREYAKLYKFNCVLLCQLRRFEQTRYDSKKDKKKANTELLGPLPTLDDLKESGEIENHSDVVVLLHRPEYYNDRKEINLAQDIIEQNAMLMIRKNRDGPTGNVPVEFHSFSMSYRGFKYKSDEREY